MEKVVYTFYEPLDLSIQQIRLVRFSNKGNKEKHSISLKIKNYAIENCHRYHAVSYAWGPRSPTQLIRVNGEYFEIRQNLYDFLLVAASKYEHETYFWIDQICIDQTSEKEKNHQVQMMGEIFSHAKVVIAWTGSLGRDSLEAQKVMAHLRAMAQRPFSRSGSRDLVPESQELVSQFLDRGYWYRLWIIQEIVLARELRILCGTSEVSSFDLVRLFPYNRRWARSFHHLIRMNSRASKRSQNLEAVVREYLHSNDWQCEKDLDTIYGVMGLVKAEDRLPVDYTISKELLYKQVIDYLWGSMSVDKKMESASTHDFDELSTLPICTELREAILDFGRYVFCVHRGLKLVATVPFSVRDECLSRIAEQQRVVFSFLDQIDIWKEADSHWSYGAAERSASSDLVI